MYLHSGLANILIQKKPCKTFGDELHRAKKLEISASYFQVVFIHNVTTHTLM